MVPVSEKIHKRQLQLKSDESQDVEDLMYQLEEAVAVKRQSETIINSLREQLLSVQRKVDKYR